jgi:hypothetical protein
VSAIGLREQLRVIAGAAPSGHYINWRREYAEGKFERNFCRIADMDRLALSLVAAGASRTVYLACAPRAWKGGGRDAVEWVECLWADCDTDDALARRSQLKPASLVIASGGLTPSGRRKLHDYWPLATHVDAETADVALKRIQRHLGSDPQCAEPARVLRPIGTTWRKDGLVRPVELVHVDPSAVYSIDDVLEGTEPLPAPEPPPPAPRKRAQDRVYGRGRRGIDYRALGGQRLGALEAVLKAIPPTIYVPALTGREPNSADKIQCPFHEDWNPSFHVYKTAERGWACFQCDNGNGRVAGGSIVDLGARLYGMDPRREYPALLRRLGHELLGGDS